MSVTATIDVKLKNYSFCAFTDSDNLMMDVKYVTGILHCVNAVGSDITHIYIINIYRFANYIGRRTV